MTEFTSMRYAAIDVTSLFAAESFIEACQGKENVDPDGETCLATLIDLVINCEHVKLAIPKDTIQAGELFRLLTRNFKTIPNAAITLSDEVEARIAAAFNSFLKERGWRWFEQWSAFQLTHPLVTNDHVTRLGGRVISQEGLEIWPQVRKKILKSRRWSQYLAEWAKSYRPAYNLGGLPAGELPMCYTFDVFRRGWQYAESVRRSSATTPYVPHPLRLHCLNATATWDSVTFKQTTLWSWGKYICAVLRDPELKGYKSPEAVVALVKRIRSAMVKRGEPTWDSVHVLGAGGVDREHLMRVHSWIVSIAKDAKLPPLRRPRGIRGAVGEAGVTMFATALEKSLEAVSLTLPIFVSLGHVVAGGIAPNMVARAETSIEVCKRRFLKAQVDFGPLLPPARRRRRHG